MTFTIGHVEGGTNAGNRRIKRDREPWFCGCFEVDADDRDNVVKKLQYSWRERCDDCGEKRPK